PRSRISTTCTPPAASCCGASAASTMHGTRTGARWPSSTTTPSGACSSGGWTSSISRLGASGSRAGLPPGLGGGYDREFSLATAYPARILLVAAAYFGSAKLGLALAYAQGNVT